ncbi:proepiregulin isoform X2 [Amia ocellicauda]|uniref:proepiregulin isoform X2 n=1 Tax=Amia ocellicauda TaxID=2972642 RepID=UPI0034645B0F
MTGFQVLLLLLFLGLLHVPHIHSTTPSPTCGPGQLECSTSVSPENSNGTPHIAEVRMQKCESDMDTYCFHGECMFLLDINEHHCRCDQGFTGPRCAHSDLVFKPLSDEYVILTVVCVALFCVAGAGAFYFFYKWYKKNKCTPKEKNYQEVQLA